MRAARDRLYDILCNSRHANREVCADEPGGAGLADIDLNIYRVVRRQCDLL